MFENTPVIKLGDHFIQQFQERLKKIPKIIPKIIELDHLTVTGDVYFGCNATLRGTVIGAHFPCSCSFLIVTDHLLLQSQPMKASGLIFRMAVSWRIGSCPET